jgi:uncharacterized protein (DUF697 family)
MLTNQEKKQDWYESIAITELNIWLSKIKKKPSLMNRLTKGTQRKLNQLIPEKIHRAITYAIEKMVKGVLFGSKYLTSYPKPEEELWASERRAKKILKIYQKTASIEGAVTGAGGILMGFADFPAFLGIKMKMLFEMANAYGHNVKDFKERLFILYIFKLTFSSQKTRNETISLMENWEEFSKNLPEDLDSFDWMNFQLEYRDYMDLAKLAQLIPIIGAPVGAIANYKLTGSLGEMALNCYRLRYFTKSNKSIPSSIK